MKAESPFLKIWNSNNSTKILQKYKMASRHAYWEQLFSKKNKKGENLVGLSLYRGIFQPEDGGGGSGVLGFIYHSICCDFLSSCTNSIQMVNVKFAKNL
jgi:hypothetical protein